MMNRLNRNKEYAYTKWRENFLRVTLIIASIVGLGLLIPAILVSTGFYTVIYVAIYISVLAATFLPAPYNVKAVFIILLLYILSVAGLTETGIYGDARLYMLGAITLASLLFSWRAGWVVTALTMITYIVFAWLVLGGTIVVSASSNFGGTLNTWVTGSMSVLVMAILIVNGIRLTQTEFEKSEDFSKTVLEQLRKEQANLEQNILERTQSLDKRTTQFQAVAAVGKSITSFRNLDELLQQATRLIHQNFGYYHAGIFLLDERGEYAVLAAANSEGGQRMMERKHQLKVGGGSIVGFVTENIQARIALDVGQDAVYFDNPDLPQTRSEMALPLVASGQVLGALDVQSTEPQAFTQQDVDSLQVLAEQIAVAIQNAKLFNEAEKALEAARTGYGEISRDAWGRILRSQPRVGYIATTSGISQLSQEKPEPGIERALQTGDLILLNNGLVIGVPIKIRGQVIGAIRLKKPDIANPWTQEEINLAITLSDQLSGALESARLYRESQMRASRESLVSDISAKIGSATEIETIVRETANELGQALGTASVTFQLLGDLDKPDSRLRRDLFERKVGQ